MLYQEKSGNPAADLTDLQTQTKLILLTKLCINLLLLNHLLIKMLLLQALADGDGSEGREFMSRCPRFFLWQKINPRMEL
jgi:hypothetical protein